MEIGKWYEYYSSKTGTEKVYYPPLGSFHALFVGKVLGYFGIEDILKAD